MSPAGGRGGEECSQDVAQGGGHAGEPSRSGRQEDKVTDVPGPNVSQA